MTRPDPRHVIDVTSTTGTLTVTRDGSYVVFELHVNGHRASQAVAGINDIDFDYFGEPVLRAAEYLFWMDPVALLTVHEALCLELGDAFRGNVSAPPCGLCAEDANG